MANMSNINARRPDIMGCPQSKSQSAGAEASTMKETREQFSVQQCSQRVAQLPTSAFPVIPGLSKTVKNIRTQAQESLGTVLKTRRPCFRFLDLPAEVRNMIYEEVLVVGKVFFSPRRHDLRNGNCCGNHRSFVKPGLAFQRACRTIHSEAEPIYLSKNLFVLPNQWHTYHSQEYPGCRGISPCNRPLFSKLGHSHTRNVSIAIDKELFSSDQHWEFNFEHWNEIAIDQADGGPIQTFSERERFDIIHEYELDSAMDTLDWMMRELKHFHNIEYLEVDFTNAFCLMGHCKPIDRIFNLPDTEWIKDIAPKRLDILGMSSQKEQTDFIASARNQLGISYLDLKAKYGLRFRHSAGGTHWDKWMMAEPENDSSEWEESDEGSDVGDSFSFDDFF